MTFLREAFPFLVLDLESALVHLGRGDIADQLKQATVERWTYDEVADTAYLHLRAPRASGAATSPGETVSIYDELGINLDTDSEGRLTGIEILGGQAVIAQLERGAATWPRSP